MDQVVSREGNFEFSMEDIADSVVETVKSGAVLDGEVVSADASFVYVSIGAKQDGRIPIEEFTVKPEYGKKLPVILKSRKPVDGLYDLSYREALAIQTWRSFREWHKSGNKNFRGRIISSIKNGKLVDCMGIGAFLPFSLAADLKAVSGSEDEYDFAVRSADEKKKSVIVSRKDFLDEQTLRKWEDFAAKYNAGDRIEGEILRFVEFGAFVDVGGVDALLHRNDMTWKNVFKQRKLFKTGERREFLILNINREERKISLGLKQLSEDPWINIGKKYSEGAVVNGEVVTIVNSGAFIEIEDGVEGFVGNQDLSWLKQNSFVRDFLTKGEKREFMVLGVNHKDKKVILGIKQLAPDPWQSIDQKYSVGGKYIRPVRKVAKFGLFVELEENIDALIHISDISWDTVSGSLESIYSEGQDVEFRILEIKKDRHQIACGIKHLTSSPWEQISEKYPPGKKVSGIVSGMTGFGIFMKIEDNVEGLIHVSQLAKEKIEDIGSSFKIGDEIEAVVVNVDIQKKRLSLSKKEFDIQSEKEEVKKVLNDSRSSVPRLGDLINIQLGDK